jgi:hypothetical protein
MQALTTPATEVLYGGAAGGGKSHLMRVAAIAWALSAPGVQVVIVRREFPDLKANHFSGRQGFPALLMPWIASGQVRFNVSDLTITFPNGSTIVGKHCQREKDVDGFQGSEIDGLLVDELTHFTAYQYEFIRSRCRSANLPPGRFRFPRILCGSNPGSVGHNWVKGMWVDPRPVNEAWQAEGGWMRQFIPARLADNPSLGQEYAASLEALPEHLRKALRDGDWNIVAGGMFDDVWRGGVVRSAIPIPASWRRSRSFDWGSSKPFAVCWWAQSDGTTAPGCMDLPKGSWVLTDEWYGWSGKPNEGAKMLAVEVAQGIKEREAVMGIKDVAPGPADSAIFASENGNCIADDMAKRGVRWVPAEKGPGSRVNGWEKMRSLMQEAAKNRPEGPCLVIFDRCRHACRTLPTLPRDHLKTDDVDTDAEDHIADAVRYRVMQPDRKVGGILV